MADQGRVGTVMFEGVSLPQDAVHVYVLCLGTVAYAFQGLPVRWGLGNIRLSLFLAQLALGRAKFSTCLRSLSVKRRKAPPFLGSLN